MHFFAGIVSLTVAVSLFYGMTDVWPKASYTEEVARIDAARKEKNERRGK